jgi:hypothetical protein
MLLHKKGKLKIAKLKSSRLSYRKVVSLPLESISSKISRYEADLSDSVVSFIMYYVYGVTHGLKPVWTSQSNKEYEPKHSVYGRLIIYIRKKCLYIYVTRDSKIPQSLII